MTSVEPQAALLFSIGPVQDFIATARKGQDLWFGSWLLSELTRTAAETAQARGAFLIMPAPTLLTGQGAVANKVVARVAAKDAVAVANAVEGAARKKLTDLAKSVFDHVPAAAGEHLQRRNADAQVADLPEIAWVVVDEVSGDWGETRRRAEAALAARKSLRDFGPVTWGAPVPKSRLDGQRESVIAEAAFAGVTQNGRAERLRQSFGVGPAERLCGVGLLKRNGRHAIPAEQARGARVISTAHVASWSLRRAWDDLPAAHTDLKQAFADLVAALPDRGASLSEVPLDHEDPVLGKTDGAVLFAGQLADDYEGSHLVTARRALSGFLREARRIVEQHGGLWRILSPYYAVVRADGDRMGAWLDGLSTPEDHQSASAALAGFAASAETVVAQHHGHCVFAGGDDVLALLPRGNALVHRDYLISAPIRLFLFDDRIEIISPGTLPNNLTVENIRAGNSNLRNPILASFVAKGVLPYRGLGSGVPRALEAWPDIEFRDDRDGGLFVATVRRKAVSASIDLHGDLHGSTMQVGEPLVRLVEHLNGEMARQELQAALSLNNREHFRVAYLLPALEAGLVEMTRPDKPNSRSQRYRLTPAGEALRAKQKA